MVGWQEGHLACRIPEPLILRGSALEQVEGETEGNQLTQLHLEYYMECIQQTIKVKR